MKTALVSGMVAIVCIFFSQNVEYSLYSIFFTSFILGIANGAFRTCGILMGTRITPKHKLHLVIAASDSIVRPVAGGMVAFIGFMVHDGGWTPIMLLLAIIALCISIAFYFIAGAKNYDLG